MQTGNTDFIYRNELDKACFQHVMAYGKSKDLIEITQSNKVLRDKAFEIANDPKYDGYQTGLASMGFKFFDKKFIYLLETIFGIWDVDLADMQSLSKYNKGSKYLLCAIRLSSKYVWVVPLKNKREISIVNAFQKKKKKKNSKGRKPNKLWVDEGGEFYNNLFKRYLKIKNIEMYSTYNKGKSVVAERFFRTLKNKVFKHMIAVSKNVYFNVLNDIVNK